MKKLAIVIILLVTLAPNYIVAENNNIDRLELISLANKEIIDMGLLTEDYFAEVNIVGKTISKNEYLKDYRNYIVYGDTFGDFKDNRYRYLGWTMMNDKFTNYLFPNDVTSTIGLWNRNWIEKPKRNPLTREREEVINEDGKFDNNPLYEESIREGLRLISRKNLDGSLLDFPEDELKKRGASLFCVGK